MTPVEPSRTRAFLSPNLNPTGLASAASALWAAGVMIWNATHHHGVIDPQVVVAALAAAAFLYTRFKVTPVANPKDGAGNPLISPPVFRLPLDSPYGAGGFPGGPPVTTVMTGGATSPPLSPTSPIGTEGGQPPVTPNG